MDARVVSSSHCVAALYASVPLGTAESKNIRVLDLEPGFRTRRLRARLRVVSLRQLPLPVGPDSNIGDTNSALLDPSTKVCDDGSAPQYEALSYTWGAITQGRTILLDNEVHMTITDNLYQALRRLRLVTKVRTIWVDALCINQSSDIERSQQVKNMDLIYKTSSCVNIWLGEPGFVFPISRAMLRWIWEYRQQFWKLLFAQPENLLFERGFSWQALQFHPEAMEKAIRRSSPRWYDRVWVAQEYILAKNQCFCYGSRRIKNLERLSIIGDVLSKGNFDHLLALGWSVWHTWFGLQTYESPYAPSLSRDGIPSVAACSATDSRDRVYGILAFITPEERALIPVDYSLSSAAVFAAASAASMVVQQDHEILRYVDFSDRETHDLPSWAVDFNAVDKMMNIKTMEPYLAIHSSRWQGKDHYVSHTHTSVHSLFVRGHNCGTVANVIPLQSFGQMSTLLEHQDRIREFLQGAAYPGPEWITSIKANDSIKPHSLLLKNLAMDVKAENLKQLKAKWQSEWPYVDQLVRTSELGGPPGKESGDVVKVWMDIILQAPNNLYVTVENTRLELRDLCQYVQYSLAASNGCSLFSTSSGLIGISPSSIAVGDFLILGQGSNLPFLVLRPEGTHYLFRGLPLIHGLNFYSSAGELCARHPDLATWAGVTRQRDSFEIQ